jgi:hypothetical protein
VDPQLPHLHRTFLAGKTKCRPSSQKLVRVDFHGILCNPGFVLRGKKLGAVQSTYVQKSLRWDHPGTYEKLALETSRGNHGYKKCGNTMGAWNEYSPKKHLSIAGPSTSKTQKYFMSMP